MACIGLPAVLCPDIICLGDQAGGLSSSAWSFSGGFVGCVTSSMQYSPAPSMFAGPKDSMMLLQLGMAIRSQGVI